MRDFRFFSVCLISALILLMTACHGGTYDVDDGEERYTYENGTVIEAEFMDGEIVGECTVKLNNGDVYKGKLDGGNKIGQGEYIYSCGDVYIGDFKDDKMDGKGKLTRSNGDTFEGTFSADHIVKGTFLPAGKEYTYIGKFENDQLSDTEAMIDYADGTTYEGSVVNGKLSGKGKLIYNDKSWISGEFVDGKLQGKAVFCVPDNIDTFYNNVRYHLFKGENEVTVKDGAIVSVP